TAVAGIGSFFFHGNGVDVRRIQLDGNIHARLASPPRESFEYARRSAGPVLVHYLVKCFKPFVDFLQVRLYGLRRLAVYYRCAHPTCIANAGGGRNERAAGRLIHCDPGGVDALAALDSSGPAEML